MFYTSVDRPWYVILKEKKTLIARKKNIRYIQRTYLEKKKKLKTTIKRYFVHLIKIFNFFFCFK